MRHRYTYVYRHGAERASWEEEPETPSGAPFDLACICTEFGATQISDGGSRAEARLGARLVGARKERILGLLGMEAEKRAYCYWFTRLQIMGY